MAEKHHPNGWLSFKVQGVHASVCMYVLCKYVCMQVCMYVLCMYVCLYVSDSAARPPRGVRWKQP